MTVNKVGNYFAMLAEKIKYDMWSTYYVYVMQNGEAPLEYVDYCEWMESHQPE